MPPYFRIGLNQAWNLRHFSVGRGEYASASQETGNGTYWIWSEREGWGCDRHVLMAQLRRWSLNPSGKCSYEQLTRVAL